MIIVTTLAFARRQGRDTLKRLKGQGRTSGKFRLENREGEGQAASGKENRNA
jgi:hypothetical protein